MIKPEQIRAARALLDWSTAELARQTGLTVNGINKIERGHVQAHRDTVDKLGSVFEAAGIEFLDNQGVRMRPEGLEILKGPEGIRIFLDNAYAYAQSYGGVMRQNGIEDAIFFASADAITKEHCDRMVALRKSRQNIVVRVLVSHGQADFKCPEYAEYKWFPRSMPTPIPFYVFGNTVGIFALDQDATPKIYQITSPIIAATYTKQFDSAWSLAEDPIVRELRRL